MKASSTISMILRKGLRSIAIMLSFLVALQISGASTFIEEIEEEVVEEQVKIEYTRYDKHVLSKRIKKTKSDHILFLEDFYDFSPIEKDKSPSSIRKRLYILYLQLAYDKKAMISLS